MYNYFEIEQFKTFMFLLIFVVDTKIFFGCNFGAPFTKPKKYKNEKIKNSEVTRKQLNN